MLMSKIQIFRFFRKILPVDLKEVVSVGALSIIGEKQGKKKEKGVGIDYLRLNIDY